jgi:hypothetical protein
MFEFLFMVVLTAILTVVAELIRPKPKIENARPAHLGDFSFPTATEGRVVPLVWGTVRIDGPNVVWYGNLENEPIKKKVKTGMFSSKKVVTGYQYSVGMQFALCRGDVDFLSKIWIGEVSAWEGVLGESFVEIEDENFFGGKLDNGGIDGKFSFYLGSREQLPSAYLGQTPPDYLWFDDFSANGGDPLNEYKGSDAGAHYFVANKGQVGAPTGGDTNDDSDVMRVLEHTVAEDALPSPSNEAKVRSTYGGTAPGDLNRYMALLLHPERPRLGDNVKAVMTFIPKAAGAFDFAAHGLWLTVKCEDQGSHNSNYHVAVNVDDSTVNLHLFAPGMANSVILDTATAVGGDFTIMTGKHSIELRVEGDRARVFLDGINIIDETDSRILDIPENYCGVCVGIEGNLNVEFFSSNDWSAAGIYSLAVDSTTRKLESSVPAYRGTCYGVWEGGYIGNSSQIQPWAFELRRCPNPLALTSNRHIVNGFDCNPMNMLYEILLDPDWGLAQLSSDIDVDNFREAAYTLFDEGNGISMNIDDALECSELIREIERQVDGILFVNRTTGKWQITLARGGYELEDLTSINETNTVEVKEFTRGAWEETTNNINVEFANRTNEYKVTYATAQDSANIRIQANTMVSVTAKYPGVKSRALANQLAWRDLRTLAYPIAKCTVLVDRTFHSRNPGDLVRVTITSKDIVDLPMRITRMDLGRLDDGVIELNLIQDTFGYDLPSFADPDNTQWLLPGDTAPQNIETADRVVFEAPLKFLPFADENPGVPDRVWIGARSAGGGGAGFALAGRQGSDPYAECGEVAGYLVRGKLKNAVSGGTTQGTDTLVIETDGGDTLLAISKQLESHTSKEVGTSLFNLLLIDNEFVAHTGYTLGSGIITLTGVYRGMLDTVPAAHAVGAKVWFLSTSGNLTDLAWTPGATVQIRPLPQNLKGELDVSLATPSNVLMNNRVRRPYPPTNFKLDGVPYPETMNLDSLPAEDIQGWHDANLGGTYTPDTPDYFESAGIQEVGMKFDVLSNGYVLAARWFRTNTNQTGTFTANLWNKDTATLLATKTFPTPTGLGAQYAYFDLPVPVTVGVNYIISYSNPSQHLSLNGINFFNAATRGQLHHPGYGSTRSAAGSTGTIPTSDEYNDFGIDPIIFFGTVGLLDAPGAEASYTRRDYRNTNEVNALLNESSLAADFPTANTTEWAVDVRIDPDTTNTLLYTVPFANQSSAFLSRTKILRYANGVPARLRVAVRTQHTLDATVRAATQFLQWDFDTESTLSLQTFLGVKAVNVASTGYVAVTTGTFTLMIGSALTTGAVEVELNGSATWTPVIAATATSGTFSVTAADSIKVRHTQTGANTSETLFQIVDDSDVPVAYGVLTY